MKIFIQLLAISSLLLFSCAEKTDESTTKKESKEEVVAIDHSYDHILDEAYLARRSLHYFDDNAVVSKRMILAVTIDDDGSLKINDNAASMEDLSSEMRNFYFANRELGAGKTQAYRENDSYAFSDYPFFNYFDQNSFQTYLNQLEKMARRDSTAKRYYAINKRRFSSFQATDGEILPFLEFGALISIQYSDSVEDSRLAEIENKIAETICSFRNKIAQEKFGTDYYHIREMGPKETEYRVKMTYIREMIPAYILKTNRKDIKATEMQLPPMPPPPLEKVEAEDEEPPVD
jgi:hypothetical protein